MRSFFSMNIKDQIDAEEYDEEKSKYFGKFDELESSIASLKQKSEEVAVKSNKRQKLDDHSTSLLHQISVDTTITNPKKDNIGTHRLLYINEMKPNISSLFKPTKYFK